MGLDTVQLVMDVEEAFDIEISNEEAENILTVGQLAECTARLVSKKSNEQITSAQTLPKIRDILENNFGIPKERIHKDAKIVDDLGLD